MKSRKSSRSVQTRLKEAENKKQTSILSFYEVKPKAKAKKQRRILREETCGITVGHLRRCARLGGVVPLGELAFNLMVCEVCRSGEDDANMIICDKCNKGFHLYCLKPILPSVPSGDWFCEKCVSRNKDFYNKRKSYYKDYQTEIESFFHFSKPRTIKYSLRNKSILSFSFLS